MPDIDIRSYLRQAQQSIDSGDNQDALDALNQAKNALGPNATKAGTIENLQYSDIMSAERNIIAGMPQAALQNIVDAGNPTLVPPDSTIGSITNTWMSGSMMAKMTAMMSAIMELLNEMQVEMAKLQVNMMKGQMDAAIGQMQGTEAAASAQSASLIDEANIALGNAITSFITGGLTLSLMIYGQYKGGQAAKNTPEAETKDTTQRQQMQNYEKETTYWSAVSQFATKMSEGASQAYTYSQTLDKAKQALLQGLAQALSQINASLLQVFGQGVSSADEQKKAIQQHMQELVQLVKSYSEIHGFRG